MGYYLCSASWFSCPPGSGACALCYPNQMETAWPNVQGHPPNYARCFDCVDLLPCGAVLQIYSQCQPQNIISVCVADHGSGAACSPSPPVARLVDLTPAAFLALGRPLSDGLAKVLAYVGSGTCDW